MDMRAKTGLVSDPVYKKHDTGGGHPECPSRVDAVMQGISEHVSADVVVPIRVRSATRDELEYCHPGSYIDLAKREVEAGWKHLSTGDTDICPCSYEVALLAVGGVLSAVDAVFNGEVRNAFCAVRPPGHHATADRGMGFCIFNSIAVAARYAQRRHGVERVAIIDWDVHHGNGTQDIFYEDASVFYFSTHQSPLYPGTGAADETGAGKGQGCTLNVPVPSGSTGDVLKSACTGALMPALEKFKPEFILISAGFDTRKDEPISGLLLEDRDFGELTGLVLDIADQHTGGRLVSSLEGGYGLEGLASSAGTHVRILAESGVH